MAENLTRQILKEHLADGELKPGSAISLRMDQALLQDATGTMALMQFEELATPRVKIERAVQYVDHNVVQLDYKNPDDHRMLQALARKYGLHFSRPGNGISHYIHMERYGKPGQTMLGADSHTTQAGCMGMIAIGAGGLDVAVVLGGHPYEIACPEVVEVHLEGKLGRPWVQAKDIILELLRRLSASGGKNKVFEFTGPGKEDLSIPERATIANMIADLGGTSAVFPPDESTRECATEITAAYGDKIVKVPVTTESCDVNLPINFANQIVPIFTKLGCNSGGCHGKASGQNGFKISLLGFEPEVDFNALVKEARGRRLFPAAPDSSLLLLKAAGGMAHGGGKRMEVGSDEYRLIRRWIAAGMPFGEKSDPVVTRISVFPEHRVMTRNNHQQFAVYAHYSDGRVEDITRRAQYESNDQEIAVVDSAGLVRTLGMSGEAAVMVRYQEHVSTFRATVPLGAKTPNYTFPVQTLVDKYTQKKWRDLGLVPSELCSDEQFIRRLSLDLTATLPAPAQVQAFVADKDPRKRDKLVDRLLDSEDYSYYFANKWADILRVKRRGQPDRARGTFAFHDWIRAAVARDKPYDEFARAILGASGDEVSNPPTVWYKELQQPGAVRGRHRSSVPRSAFGLRSVPSPPLREVESGRLLGHRRFLRPRRSQEGAGSRRD